MDMISALLFSVFVLGIVIGFVLHMQYVKRCARKAEEKRRASLPRPSMVVFIEKFRKAIGHVWYYGPRSKDGEK